MGTKSDDDSFVYMKCLGSVIRAKHFIFNHGIMLAMKFPIWWIVWQKLEEENADFFRAYYIRLKLKKQIILFNHLLEHQYHLMKYPVPPKLPVAPIHNGIHPMPGNLLLLHCLLAIGENMNYSPFSKTIKMLYLQNGEILKLMLV